MSASETESTITKLSISISKDDEEILAAQDYQIINVDFSSGTGGSRKFLWYKKECGMTPITRIQFSFLADMETGLDQAGFEKINRNLNIDGGSEIFLWFFYGKTESDIPIVDIEVSKDPSEEPDFLKNGWERLGCDLRRNAGGNSVYLWVKRQKPSYICEIGATTEFGSDKHKFDLGFTRVDEDTNRAAGGNYVFLWYRRLPDKSKALTALNVSSKFQEDVRYQNEGFKKLTVNLNEGTGGSNVYAWHTKKGCDPHMQNMVILVNQAAWTIYQKAGVEVIQKNLNEGNKGRPMYLAYQ